MFSFLTKAARAAALAIIVTVGLGAPQAAAQTEDPVREVHGDWEIRCAADGRCYMHQLYQNADGQPVVVVNLVKIPAGAAIGGKPVIASAEIITPLGVHLPTGLGLRIDAGQVAVTPYTFCRPVGCASNPPLTDALVEQLKNGGTAYFLMRRIGGGDVVEAPISLSGFTAAFDAL